MELPPDEPVARLDVAGEERLMHRYNSALFTHIGELAMYDHIFVQNEESEEADVPVGMYIFEMNPAYATLARFMIENHFTRHLDLTYVADCDKDAFEPSVSQQLRDLDGGVPDGWGG